MGVSRHYRNAQWKDWYAVPIILLFNTLQGVHSEGEGFGSTFYFELPLLDKGENVAILQRLQSPREVSIQSLEMFAERGSQNGCTSISLTKRVASSTRGVVLIVDDSTAVRKMHMRGDAHICFE